METIIVALIGACATIFAAYIANKKKVPVKKAEDTNSHMNTPILALISLGTSLTTLAVVISILIFPLNRVEEELKSLSIDEPEPLEKYLDTPIIPELERLKKTDAAAKGIISGAGPKELTVNKRVWKKGDILYVPTAEWVNIAFTNNERDILEYRATCVIHPGGKLTIQGFNIKRKSVLFQYEAPKERGGTSCDTGIYFFYIYESSHK